MDNAETRQVAWPEIVAIALVSIPTALFFASWFRPSIGVPAALATLWTAWKLSRDVAPAPLPPRRAMLLLAVLAVSWSWIAGQGGFFQQMWDHNFRNALLHDLVDHPWPVYWKTPGGSVVLDYYLAWSMVPAMIGKLLGWRAASLTMALVCAIGVFLVLLVFVRVLGVLAAFVYVGSGRAVFRAVGIADHLAHGGKRFIGNADAVGTDICNQADRAVANVYAFI